MDDEARFRLLFDQNFAAVIRYAYNRGHRGPDAEDLVAATFEVAWRRLSRVPLGEGATPWLLAVARNLSRNLDRRTRREHALVEPLLEPEKIPGPDRVDDGVVSRGQLRGALAELKEIDRELILLVAWDGLSPAHAGEVLGLRAGAARSRLHRARNQLSALLDSVPGTAVSRHTTVPGSTNKLMNKLKD